MSDYLASTLKRLDEVVGSLEKNLAQDEQDGTKRVELEMEITHLTNERNHLSRQLEEAKERIKGLEIANRHVSRRLIKTMESIRSVLEE